MTEYTGSSIYLPDEIPGLTEKSSCPLCGSRDFEYWFTKEYYLDKADVKVGICRCYLCESIYFYPRPTKDAYISHLKKMEYVDTSMQVLNKLYKVRRNLFIEIADILDNLKPYKGKVLDVGCSYGFLMDVLEQRGWAVEGVDISNECLEYNKSRDRSMHLGHFNDILLPGEFFDLVLFIDSLYYSPTVREDLKKAYEVLNKDGILLIRTTNANFYRIFKVFLKKRILGDNLFSPSFKALNNLLADCGFHSISVVSLTGAKKYLHTSGIYYLSQLLWFLSYHKMLLAPGYIIKAQKKK